MTGRLVTGTENSKWTAVPATHSGTNTPAVPASLILRDRPRIVARSSGVVTWSSVSISYRGYRLLNGDACCSTLFIGIVAIVPRCERPARHFADLFCKPNKLHF